MLQDQLQRDSDGIAPTRIEVPDYDVVALVLQGGGALGAYQAGVYEGLHEAGIRPDWLAGISIGALNAAVIAGSPESERVDRLREFWETICAEPMQWPGAAILDALPFAFDLRSTYNATAAMRALLQGQGAFFKPRFPPPFLSLSNGDAATRTLRWPRRLPRAAMLGAILRAGQPFRKKKKQSPSGLAGRRSGMAATIHPCCG